MSALYVPYLAGVLLLLVAGVPKVLDPSPTMQAASGTGLPSGARAVRGLGLAETVLACSALVLGGPAVAVAVAAAYAAFALVVARGLVRGDMDTCGCFNGDQSPPSVLHVLVDLGIAASALVAALTTGGSPAALALVDDAAEHQAVLLLAAVVAVLGYVVLTAMPRTSHHVELAP